MCKAEEQNLSCDDYLETQVPEAEWQYSPIGIEYRIDEAKRALKPKTVISELRKLETKYYTQLMLLRAHLKEALTLYERDFNWAKRINPFNRERREVSKKIKQLTERIDDLEYYLDDYIDDLVPFLWNKPDELKVIDYRWFDRTHFYPHARRTVTGPAPSLVEHEKRMARYRRIWSRNVRSESESAETATESTNRILLYANLILLWSNLNNRDQQ